MKIQKQPDYLIFADSAKKGENAEFPDISRGWGITIEQTASKPPMEWMNGAFNRIDKNMLYLLQQGVPEWSELVTYPVNAIIKYNGVLYTAIVENDNTKPSANTTKWKKTQAEIPTASTTQKGIVQLSSSINSKLETEAATSLAVKTVSDNAVKKYGDTMVGNLTIANSDSSAVLLKNNKNDEWMVRIHEDGSFSIFNRNSNGKWISKFRNDSNANVWRFENTADVTIAGKSVLKTGDYGIGALTGISIQNLDEHLNCGFYGTNTSKIPNLPFAGGGSASSLLVLPTESPHWKVEQLSVVDGRIPKIYYRTDTKTDGKQNWYEAITTANINDYMPAGIPQPWPSNQLPSGWLWCDGAPFNVQQFPKLARAYPRGVLPDLRGLFIRGKDNGRGIDPDRAILSFQDDAIRNILGDVWPISETFGQNGGTGTGAFSAFAKRASGTPTSVDTSNAGGFSFDASRVVPVANENRPKNIAFNYIVRAE